MILSENILFGIFNISGLYEFVIEIVKSKFEYPNITCKNPNQIKTLNFISQMELDKEQIAYFMNNKVI